MTILDIGTPPQRPARLTRRRMLQLAVALGPLAACAPQTAEQAAEAQAAGIAPWPTNIDVPKVDHPGYGLSPDYFEIGETGPWPKILGDVHRAQLEKLSDLFLPATDTAPAPSAVGIGDFFDDWVSAPYPYMTGTRREVYEGFAWMDAQAGRMFGTDWLGTTEVQAKQMLDMMRDGEGKDGPLSRPAGMYLHLRKIIIGAYYTTPEGEADLGHIAAEPMTGDYPGPTGEALEHIEGLIKELDLSWDDLPKGPPPYPNKTPYQFTADNPPENVKAVK